ncbi:MAG: Verru_Chthon cassette protein D [Candidatus Methylacidiphilales bacterium]|nr:Verru_Chthon cassette protein D [Candidatus Methylacidiphilales bacterium]
MKARGASAFTLMELVAVMAIIAVIATLSLPAIMPMMRSSSLNTGAGMVVDELNLARQTALTENREVQVRLYKLPSSSDSSDVQFRAFRCFVKESEDPVQWKPLTKVRYLSDQVIFSADPKYSTLLDDGNAARSGLSRSTETFPGSSVPTTYVSFSFRPDGGTNLSPIDPPLGNWFLTLHLAKDPKNATTGLPNNYFTTQVEPVTGRVRTFRP